MQHPSQVVAEKLSSVFLAQILQLFDSIIEKASNVDDTDP